MVAIVEMAHALGLQVVAEGVTTVDQHRFLARCGCDKAQGYLWSPALTADDFLGWWRARTTTPGVGAIAAPCRLAG